MLAVAGLGLPTALILSDEMVADTGNKTKEYIDKNGDGVSDIVDGPTESMLGFSRLNAVIMVLGYGMYLLFQLGTHGEEFDDLVVMEEEEDDDDDDDYEVTEGQSGRIGLDRSNGGNYREAKMMPSTRTAKRNKFCSRLFGLTMCEERHDNNTTERYYERVTPCPNEIELSQNHGTNGSHHVPSDNHLLSSGTTISASSIDNDTHNNTLYNESDIERTSMDDTTVHSSNVSRKRIPKKQNTTSSSVSIPPPQDAPMNGLKNNSRWTLSSKSHCSDGSVEEGEVVDIMMPISEVCEEMEEGEFVLFCLLALKLLLPNSHTDMTTHLPSLLSFICVPFKTQKQNT